MLRREERGGAAWLSGAAYGILAVVALAWLAAIVAAVTRFERVSTPAIAGTGRVTPAPPSSVVDTLSAAK